MRLFREAGHTVVELPLHKRVEYAGTEVRRRIVEGDAWRPLVPASVAGILDEIDAEGRLAKIGLEGSQDEKAHHHA